MKGFLAIVLLAAAAAGAAATPIGDRFQRFDAELKAWDDAQTPEAKANSVSLAYRQMKKGLDYRLVLPDAGTADLHLLFQAARGAHFYTPSRDHALDMLAVARELAARQVASAGQLDDTYYALIGAREYGAARAWRIEHALAVNQVELHEVDLPPLPPGQAAELLFTDGKRSARTFSFPSGAYVIVVADPHCGFTRDAVARITAEQPMMAALENRIKWLAPQQTERSLQAYLDWNRRYPQAPISQAYKNEDWDALKNRQFPVFYFYRDGALQTHFAGWPKEGRMRELTEALELIGIAAQQ